MKALYHRYQAAVNATLGCVFMEADVLRDMLAAETEVASSTVTAILRDLVYDKRAVQGRNDAAYFSLMKEGAAPHRIMMRPCAFSKAEGLVNMLRVVAQRRPNAFLSNVSNVLGTKFVQRVKTAFETQGFLCRAEVSLRFIDPKLPDIDLLVIAEEPTLGFVMLICEVKSPIPPRWAKDQLRALAPDNVSKAFRQTEAIGAFLHTPNGIDFIRSVVPEGGLEHFDSFVTVIQQLIITSDNAGMFFEHEQTPVLIGHWSAFCSDLTATSCISGRASTTIKRVPTCISRLSWCRGRSTGLQFPMRVSRLLRSSISRRRNGEIPQSPEDARRVHRRRPPPLRLPRWP